MLTYTVEAEDINKRADILIQEKLPNLSRSFIKKLASDNHLVFNDKVIKSSYKFKTAGQLQFTYDLDSIGSTGSVKLDIVYEDNYLLVINKPAGLVVHARSSHHNEISVASSLRQYCNWPKLNYPIELEELRKGIVHRLDKATSGILLCAKQPDIVQALQLQFKNLEIKKTYLAIVKKTHNLPQEGLIDKPILRHPTNRLRFITDNNGRSAQTAFKIIKENFKYCLLELNPLTGRTHQIRVHLSSISCPIVGDFLYKGESYHRLMLHSFKIAFKHPATNKKMTLKTKPDLEFTNFIRNNG